MTRCEEFYEKVKRDGNFCGMTAGSYRELLHYITFVGAHSVLCELPESACEPLRCEKDPEVQAEAIKQIEKAIKYGRVPTAKQIEKRLENIRDGVTGMGRGGKNVNLLIYPMKDSEVKHHFTPSLMVGIPEEVHQNCASGNATEVHRTKVLLWVSENEKGKYHVMNEYLSGRLPIPVCSPFKVKR